MADVSPTAGLATVVGLGAVGSVAAEKLALAGVTPLRLVDRDIVEASNLERSALFVEDDIGDPKAFAAQTRLRALTPDVRIEARVKDLHGGTVQELVEESDLIVDGTDNLATRYVLNEACVHLGIPFLYGAARDAFGMVSPLRPPETPCFRCLLPPPADLDRAAPCATGDAQVASQVGGRLASHALRFLADGSIERGLFLLRSGDPAAERLVVSPRPGCLACQEGTQEFPAMPDGPTVVQLCGENTVSIDPGREGRIELAELANRLAPFARVRLTPYLLSVEIPPYGLSIFPDGRAIVRGVRSPQAAQALYTRYLGA
jgi:adenylyltransferase/sulfurtransferase